MRDIYFDLRHRSVEGRSHKTCWLTVTALSEAGSNDPWPVFSVLWVSPRRSLTLSIYLWHPICTDSLLAKTCVYNLRRKCCCKNARLAAGQWSWWTSGVTLTGSLTDNPCAGGNLQPVFSRGPFIRISLTLVIISQCGLIIFLFPESQNLEACLLGTCEEASWFCLRIYKTMLKAETSLWFTDCQAMSGRRSEARWGCRVAGCRGKQWDRLARTSPATENK